MVQADETVLNLEEDDFHAVQGVKERSLTQEVMLFSPNVRLYSRSRSRQAVKVLLAMATVASRVYPVGSSQVTVTIDDTEADWEMRVMVGMMILAIGAAWRQLLRIFSAWRTGKARAGAVQDERTRAAQADDEQVAAVHTRSVLVQAQTTYRWDLTQPRFQPLPEHSHGAWHQ